MTIARRLNHATVSILHFIAPLELLQADSMNAIQQVCGFEAGYRARHIQFARDKLKRCCTSDCANMPRQNQSVKTSLV